MASYERTLEDTLEAAVEALTYITANSVPVAYTGILPDLFREGQGIVAQGRMGPNGVFQADQVLAKHDENYMPPEVEDAIHAAVGEQMK